MPYTGHDYAQHFMRHRGALLNLFTVLPEDSQDFHAWQGGMSLLGLCDHLADTGEWMLATIDGKPRPETQTSATFAQTHARLEANAEALVQRLERLSEEELSRTIEAFRGRTMPLWVFIDMLREHEAHHKGQIWLMARMMGLTPPPFIKLG